MKTNTNKTKDWALVQNTTLAVDIYSVELRLGWVTQPNQT